MIIVLAMLGSSNQSSIANNLPSFNILSLIKQPDTKYSQASAKAQEAFLIQSGISDKVNMVSSSAVKKIEQAVYAYSPLDSKSTAFVAGAAYTVLVKKQITESFKSPIIPSATQTLTLEKSGGSIGISIPF